MSPDSQQAPLRPPHPLAVELIERLRERPGVPVLEVGRGSGRNRAALERAGHVVVDFDDEESEPVAAAISTHALLHGSAADIAAVLARIAGRLAPGAPFYVTFGSVRDARYRKGDRLETHTFAPHNGDERGVAHTFYDEVRLRKLLERDWFIESLEERDVDIIAGAWAHETMPLERSVHWFARLTRR